MLHYWIGFFAVEIGLCSHPDITIMADWVLNINCLAGLDSVIFEEEEEKSELMTVMCVGEKVKLAAFVYTYSQNNQSVKILC